MIFSANADCTEGNITIGVNLSNKTLDRAYTDGEASFSESDYLVSTVDGEKTIYDIGTIEDDQAGNFTINAISSETATYFEVTHDHETWHQGLDGYLTTPDNKIIDLSIFKNCDYDSLFN